MDSDSHARNKHPQGVNTNPLSQRLDQILSQLLMEDKHIPVLQPKNGDEIFPVQNAVSSSRLLSLTRAIRNKILYYVLCPPATYYCYTGFGRIMQLRWGDFASTGRQTSACLQGLPTVLAVNKQLQKETTDVLYNGVAVEVAMCDDYEVPYHWQCPKRLIDLSRLRKIVFPLTLYPACPTRSDFPPMLISAQKCGLNTRVTVLHLRAFASLLEKNQPKRELDVQIHIMWKMIDTAESVKGIESLVFPIMELSSVHRLQFSIKDSIERKDHINPAKREILAVIDRARRMTLDQGRRLIVANIVGEYDKDSPHEATDVQVTIEGSHWTALHQAASDGNEAGVQLSLKNGVHIGARDKNGFTALHYAARGGHEVAVQLLAEAGAEIDAKGTNGWTPLHQAARKGHQAVVQLLIGRGADIEAKGNVDGYTALHHAASNGRETVLRCLLGHQGIDTSPKDNSFLTPLSKAAQKGYEGVGRLLAGREDINTNARDNRNRTPLCLAAENGHLAVVQLLLGQNGVNVNPRDYKGSTPLLKAVRKGHQGNVHLLLSHKDIDANSRDDSGRSPLSLAAENSDGVLVRLLLEREDVEVESKDNDGRTPLSWVKSRKLDGAGVMRQLLEHKSVSTENLPMLEAIFDLGDLYRDNYRPEEAEKMYKRALEGKKKVVGLEHPSTLDSLHSLGIFYADQDRLAEAEELFQSALQGYERTIGLEHITTVGVVHDLGILYRIRGKLSDAEETLQRSVEAYEKSHGSDHTLTFQAVYNLGAVYQDQGKLTEAEEMYQKALIGFERALGRSHPFSRRVRDSIREIQEEFLKINYQVTVRHNINDG